MGKLTDKVARGVFWVLLEKFGIQAAHFVVTLVLARLLTPSDYGTVALLSIFVSLSNLLVDCGFGKALVQKKNATQTDYNSVFYLSMVIAVVLYAGLFFGAPLVARFYNVPELKSMLRILALSLIFHSINGVQNVELNRKMLFKLSFRVSWARVIVSSVTGVALAFAGFGPWALVYASSGVRRSRSRGIRSAGYSASDGRWPRRASSLRRTTSCTGFSSESSTRGPTWRS